jgi:hypothetical protein
MKNTQTLFAALAAAALVVALAGCYPEREPGQNRAALKAGQTVPPDMNNWVALPNTVPEAKTSGELKYAVLATHNIIPANLDGQVALDPALFTKLSGIAVEAPKGTGAVPYVLKEGKTISKDKSGYVAVPGDNPKIIKSSNGSMATAELVKSQVVPKEMNGWVAIDRDTLGKLAEAKLAPKEGDLPKKR